MTKIVIDPITRIEGHLRLEVEIENGKVTQAWSSSTMWRGIETILKGHDPREAWLLAQRICGVCTTVHALASVRSVEDALQIQIPKNARLMRNLISAIQDIQDHVIHFYHLHALDWVDITSVLNADPTKTAQLAQSISNWPKSSSTYFSDVKQRIQTFVGSGQLGIFANAYWGHPVYKLPPEVNLMATAHYLEALDWQRDFIRAQAILGGKNPHPQTYLVGGMARPVNPDQAASLNADQIAELLSLFARGKEFVNQVYLPDVLAIALFYLEWAKLGENCGNFMVYGDFPLVDGAKPDKAGDLFLPRGIIYNRDLSKVYPVDETKIGEYVTHSWYSYADEQQPKHPAQGETTPNYTGPKAPYDFLDGNSKYSWVKAPRYDGHAMEVGPLARMLVGYASGQPQIKQGVDLVLKKLGAGPDVLFSTLGRTAARCIETIILADQLEPWMMELVQNISKGDLQIHENTHWDPATWPQDCTGRGLVEAPRGALGHWVHIKDRKIENYQAIVPTTWNASPRDASNQPGPYETALVGTPVADPAKPLELLRTIHSFDPCMACAVHVLDPDHREVTKINVT